MPAGERLNIWPDRLEPFCGKLLQMVTACCSAFPHHETIRLSAAQFFEPCASGMAAVMANIFHP
jgi:hypothetical protein